MPESGDDASPVADQFAGLLEDSAEDLYENAPCGYLSTLPDGMIARVNSTFLQLTGYQRAELVGHRNFQSLLTVGDRIFYDTHYAPLLRMQHAVQEIAAEVVCADGARLPVLINATVKTDADGEVAFFRTSVFDARQRREYERELLRARQRAEASETRARELALTLQATFVPPTPPSIPYLDVGAAYRPAGTGEEVGGDFYDVFATGDDGWVVVLGDVCGKGVEAARVTALARYTLRAAAMQTPSPSTVLSILNEALRRSEEGRFCTVAYARVQPRPDGFARVTLALGGHAPPLLVRAGGQAGQAGEPGDLVGVLHSPAFHEVTLDMQPGEVLTLFTDGITEGRRGTEYYGEGRLVERVSSHAAAPAGDIANAVVTDVVEFQDGLPRDDIAVVVVKTPPGQDGVTAR